MSQAAATARRINTPEFWDKVWGDVAGSSWRAEALGDIYSRIVHLCPPRSVVVDVGGGRGDLADVLAKETDAFVTVVDHSEVALAAAFSAGATVVALDLESQDLPLPEASVIVATEVLEHLSDDAVDRIIAHAVTGGVGFFSVPNDRLAPDECNEHARSWTAKQFLDRLRLHFGKHCRVEVIGPYLLGICGAVATKQYRLSVCLPARDESADLALTLATFRGVADELVVGVDPRTVDDTREIAAKYADIVFDLETPTGPPEDKVPEAGVHFAWIRNQCLDRCTGDWVFMTEAHERLGEGEDVLLRLDEVIPDAARVAYVFREGHRQQWMFPWLFELADDIRFERSTHNVLGYPKSTFVVRLPQVRTIHERHAERDEVRAKQRKVQNRVTLMRDWLVHKNENSLHYLGAEWREHDPDKAIDRLRQFLSQPPKNGAMAYHTRLILAKQLVQRAGEGDVAEARTVLLDATGSDWSRIDHWIWLGDIAFDAGALEEAAQFFEYAATCIGRPPLTLWWIDIANYSWIPAQRLAMTYAALNRGSDALAWARRVVELIPDDNPEALEEARHNVQQIEGAIDDRQIA